MSDPTETTIFSVMTALAEETGAINLGQGFPDEDGPAAVVDAAVAAMRAGHNQYSPLPGVEPLRQAIASHQQRHYGIELDPQSQIQVTFGATEALAAALIALVGTGDEVVMLDPSYDAYRAVVALAGGRSRPIVLEPPQWRVTPDAIAAAIGPAARILLLNSPHNPTGRVLDRGELELLAAACREHDLIAITDEVYEHLVFDGEHVPISTLDGMAERTLTISSLGKTHSLTGWKIGWASGPSQLVAAVRGVKQYLSFAGGTPLQHAAATALSLTSEIELLSATLAAKRDRLAAGLRDAGFTVLDSAGTYFLSADARALGENDAMALCMRLPHESGVVAIPIGAFCADPGPQAQALLRFAFCKREDVIDEAVARLGGWAAAR
ncbi:MAG TPA: aminotransferase class I/II-fold pyridoxal phosphate-dependent enzyme [Solirubrobacteraceae bacterium]|nr:aminotransferase class I/II-fold pyridoxal phosphate-dependent enzyme [Solirubrobacteraceae bacterium]